MAINPTRPDGSYLFNRFTGAIVQAVAPGVTPSGEVPFGDPIPGTALVKFGPFEGVSARPQQYLGDGGRTNCPGYPVPGPLSGSPYAEQSWAQSTQVLAKSLDANSGLIEIDPVTPFEKDPRDADRAFVRHPLRTTRGGGHTGPYVPQRDPLNRRE
jgi:hypothetical protein